MILSLLPILAVLLVGCAQPPPHLDADSLLGASRQSLVERLGEPKHSSPEQDRAYGHMTWPDIDSVQVFVAFQDSQSTYVSYVFFGMDPFDEDRALRTVGIDLPAAAPEVLSAAGAKRWAPFESHERLTLNPASRMISVGDHPMTDLDGPTGRIDSTRSGAAGEP